MAKIKKVTYVEPAEYWPKEIREEIFGIKDDEEINKKKSRKRSSGKSKGTTKKKVARTTAKRSRKKMNK